VTGRAEDEDVDCDLIITNGTVLTVAPGSGALADGAVAVRGGEIVAVAPARELLDRAPTASVLDAGGGLILPGFVNAHCHLAMVLLRGWADDLPLKEWLEQRIWPVEARVMDAATVELGTTLAALESARAGVTCVADMYFHAERVVAAMTGVGLRLVVTEGLLDFPTPGSPSPEATFEKLRELLERYRDHPLVVPAVAPHAPYSVSAANLVRAAELAEEFGAPCMIHLAETRGEVEAMTRDKGVTPTAYLAELGVLSERTIAAHCVHVGEADLELLAEFNVAVASNPVANLKLGSGVAPVPQMLARGIRVGFGTDGAASNNTLDLLRDVQLAALLYKGITGDPTCMPARSVVELLTIGGASALGLGDRIGTLEPGKRADVVCLSVDDPHAVPVHDPWAHVAYAARAADVRHVVVDGRVVVQDRAVRTVDEAPVRGAAREFAARLRAGS